MSTPERNAELESHGIPKSVRFGFIALEFVVLALTAHLIFAAKHFSLRLGWVWMALLAMLFVSSILLLRRNRQLAISGFLIVFVSLFLGSVSPVLPK